MGRVVEPDRFRSPIERTGGPKSHCLCKASIPYPEESEFDEIVFGAGFVREDLPWPAAFLAAKTHLAYRNRGGACAQTPPDFFIGAHARVKGHRLVTRDAERFRIYFPEVEVIAPDTHP